MGNKGTRADTESRHTREGTRDTMRTSLQSTILDTSAIRRKLTIDTTPRDARGYPRAARMNEGIARNARNIDARAYHHGERAVTPRGLPPTPAPSTPPPAPTVGASLMAGGVNVSTWQDHTPLLERIAARTVPLADRADCVQEGRIALWRARGDNAPAFAFTVANRAALDYARKHCRISARGVDRETLPLQEGDAMIDPMADVDARLDGRDTIHALINAADLPTLDLQIMQWRIVDGESFATIGERIGVSSGAARVRHHRTIRRLRDAAEVEVPA